MILTNPWFLFVGFPTLALLYHWLCRRRGKTVALRSLFIASVALYARQSPGGIPWLTASLVGNRMAARGLRRFRDARHGGWLLFALIAMNLLPLALYKYSGLLAIPAWATARGPAPVGISVLTFLQIMYLVDTFQGAETPGGPIAYALRLVFFPTVTAGPLTRYREMAEQFAAPATTGPARLAAGIFLVGSGAFKKLVLAAAFGAEVRETLALGLPDLSLPGAWVFAASCLLQIYFDLSGYADLAIGMAAILGLRIPADFNRPLLATNLADFWGRWHVTLTRFFFDYLFYPLAAMFGRKRRWSFHLATLLTMLTIGLWHGPQSTYLIFGLMHGGGLVVYRIWKDSGRSLPTPLARGLTWVFLLVSFVIFCAPSWEDALVVLQAMAGWRAGDRILPLQQPVAFLLVAATALALIVVRREKRHDPRFSEEFRPDRASVALAVGMLSAAALAMLCTDAEDFVYAAF